MAEAENENTQVATRVERYSPLASVGSAGSLKALLEKMKGALASAMPKHVTPDRLIKTMLVAVNRNPDLLQCTQASVVETISRAAELGLDLSGTLGEAYPVPFNNRIKANGQEVWVKQCILIIGYRGLAKLARQSGEIQQIDADIVCVNDEFEFQKGTDFKLRFVPRLKGDRGEVVGAYAVVKFKDGGMQADFMPAEDIDKVRRRSKSGAAKDGSPMGAWKTDWPEMAKKTVFRRLAKWLPLSVEKAGAFIEAVEQDSNDFDLSEVTAASTMDHAPTKGVDAVAAKLAGKAPDPSSEPAPTPAQQQVKAARVDELRRQAAEIEAGDKAGKIDARTAEDSPAAADIKAAQATAGADEDQIAEEGTSEAEQAPAPDAGPDFPERAAIKLSEMCDCSTDAAMIKLVGIAPRLFQGTTITDLDAKQQKDLMAKISNGDIKVAPPKSAKNSGEPGK